MKVLGRLVRFVRPYWWGSAASVVLLVSMSVFRLGPGYFIKQVIDGAIAHQDMRQALLLICGLLIVSALMNVCNAAELYLEQLVGQRVIFDVRAALYDHLQSQSMSFYDANQTGGLMSRVTNDVNQVQFFLTQGFSRLVNTVVTIVVFLAFMLYLDPPLTIAAMIVTPLVYYLQRRMNIIMGIYRRLQQRAADLNVVIQEDVTGIKLVKAFNREPHEAERFNVVNWDIREGRMKAAVNMAVVSPGQEFATYLSAVIVIVFGGYQVMTGAITVGTLAAFYSYVLTMWAPVRWLAMINQMSQQAIASGERIFEILDTPFDVTEKPDAFALPRLEGRLEFEQVSFAYGKNPPLLHDITATVEPGRTLALVGPSGSGKTTLINLIPRFYDVSRGAVRVDGRDVCGVTLDSLRSQIGMVMQETFLFNMTVRENICYGRSDATQEEIEAAARAAAAHDFIMEMPDGYDTMIGERGTRLSGGQRQRLAIARAILVDPRILILDEATSSVDNRTDYLIRRALDQLMVGRTTIVIAHRLSTVKRAHQILVMEKGQVTARGTHEELLHSSPLYRHLNEIQFQLQGALEGAPAGGVDGAAGGDGVLVGAPGAGARPGGPPGGQANGNVRVVSAVPVEEVRR